MRQLFSLCPKGLEFTLEPPTNNQLRHLLTLTSSEPEKKITTLPDGSFQVSNELTFLTRTILMLGCRQAGVKFVTVEKTQY